MEGVNVIEPLSANVQQEQQAATTPNTRPITTSKTWTNPRKRPHHPDPTSLFEPVSNDDALREENNGKGLHASKRSRAAEWPLKNTDDTITVQEKDERSEKRSSSASVRPGKFLEGSMNDKISQKPPSLYTKDEQAMEEYANLQRHGQSERGMDVDVSYDAGIESHKPSGMFRFGKAIANAFKPLTAWQGMFREKEKERSMSPEKDVLQERQAKVAEAYAELKKSGYKGTQAYCAKQSMPAIQLENTEKETAPFRDSGVDMDGEPPASEWTPNDQLVGLTEALLVPPPPTNTRAASPFSDASSARKSVHRLSKPSLQGLKRVASQIHLSPVKKSSDAPPVPTINPSNASESTMLSPQAGPGLRREPSKRDIAKQYKLTKKVSDLENKLETARRELELSISNAPPVPDLPSHIGRKPFKPGALSSLPSEGNMTPLKADPAPPVPKIQGEQLGEILQSLPPQRRSTRIISEPKFFAPMAGTEGLRGVEAARSSTEMVRPRTSRGLKTQIQTPTGVHKRLPKVPSKTPNNSPLAHIENVPPVPPSALISAFSNDGKSTPTTSKLTDHTSVVHTDCSPPTFLSRSTATVPTRTGSKRNSKGISPPPPSLASAKKSNVPTENVVLQKARDESSVAPAADLTPLPPREQKKSKRGISPPPPSLASGKKFKIATDATATPVREMGSTGLPSAEEGALMSVSAQKLNGDPVKKAATMKGKLSPGERSEDFEWDDDVF